MKAETSFQRKKECIEPIRAWAKYPEAVPGTLKLLPPEYRFTALEADYNSMQDMLYGDVPTFETVIAAVRELEKEINTL